jgi:hypothetical protein
MAVRALRELCTILAGVQGLMIAASFAAELILNIFV